MNQINLKADNIRVKTSEQREGNGALIFSVFLLFLSVGLYSGLRYYHLDMKAKAEALEKDREAKLETLKDDKYAEVYYFADQLNEVQTLLQSRVSQATLMEKIGGKVIADFNGAGGTSFNNLKLEVSGGVSETSGEIQVPDFNALSAQLRALNMIDGASNVNANDVSRVDGTEIGALKAAIKFSLSPVMEKGLTPVGSSIEDAETIPSSTASTAPVQ